MRMLRRWIPMTAALALLTAGCPSGGGGGDMPPGPPQVQLSVERVFPALSFTTPVAMLQAPNDTSRWFVVEQGGVVKVFPNSPTVTMATDVAEFVNISGTGDGDRRGGPPRHGLSPELSHDRPAGVSLLLEHRCRREPDVAPFGIPHCG